jgi:hypothetical protein
VADGNVALIIQSHPCCLFSHDVDLFWQIGTFAIHEGLFLFFSTFFCLAHKFDWFPRYRIQKDAGVDGPLLRVRLMVVLMLMLILMVIVMVMIMVMVMVMVMVMRYRIQKDAGVDGPLLRVRLMVVLMVIVMLTFGQCLALWSCLCSREQ